MPLLRSISARALSVRYQSSIQTDGSLERTLFFECEMGTKIIVDGHLFTGGAGVTVDSETPSRKSEQIEFSRTRAGELKLATICGQIQYWKGFHIERENKSYREFLDIHVFVSKILFDDLFAQQMQKLFFGFGFICDLPLKYDDETALNEHGYRPLDAPFAHQWDHNPLKIIEFQVNFSF